MKDEGAEQFAKEKEEKSLSKTLPTHCFMLGDSLDDLDAIFSMNL